MQRGSYLRRRRRGASLRRLSFATAALLATGAQSLFAQAPSPSERQSFSDGVRAALRLRLPSQGRVVGGLAAEKRNWPSFVRVQADLGDGKTGYCGGVVISKRWVLTAGHCLEGRPASAFLVIEGEADVGVAGRALRVDRAVAQDRFYTDAHGAPHYDVALLHLSENAGSPPQPLISRSALDSRVAAGSQTEVAGFGLTMPQSAMGPNIGPSATHLQEARLNVFDRAECGRLLNQAMRVGASEPSLVDESNICAGDPVNANADSCNGDSGGPLAIDMQRNRVQVGVVSWGAGCAQHGTVGVYASVGYFEPWIRQYVADARFEAPEGSPAVADRCGLPEPPKATNIGVEIAEGDSLRVGQTIHVRATPGVEGQLVIVNVDLGTCRSHQLFPNSFTRNAGVGAFVAAGQTVSIPTVRDASAIKVQGPAGANRLYALVVPAGVAIDDLVTPGRDLLDGAGLLRSLVERGSRDGHARLQGVGVHEYRISP
jgi:secreted trypsin-like serine protease